MANNNNNAGKKGGPAVTSTQAAQAPETISAPKKDNLFSRHGNQQITEAIQTAQSEQKESPTLLATLGQEAEVESEKAPSWATEKEDETQMARKPEADKPEGEKKATNTVAATMLTGSNAAQEMVSRQATQGLADKNTDGEALMAGADKKQLDALKSARQSSSRALGEEAVMLAMAEGKGLDEDKKAEMLLASGKEVDLTTLENESGELRTLVVAQQMPAELAGFARDAAGEAAQNPLSERDTMKNLMDQILVVSQQLGNYSELTNPELSIEDKATKLVEIVSNELDIPTLESVSSHPYHALIEDMIFDPAGVMSINRVAGNRRNVRTMGAFSVILWQLSHDALETRLENLEDKKQINEKDFLSDTYREMSREMFTKAMQKPSGV